MRLKFEARKRRYTPNHSTSKLLSSLKRAVDGRSRNYECAQGSHHGSLAPMVDSQQAILNQAIRIETELRRNAGMIYANTIPPR